MKPLRIVLHLLLFLGIGEALIRFDRQTAFFRSEEHLANEPKATALLTTLRNSSFVPGEDELRVMVVGDSFLFGAGVALPEIFSNQLQASLERSLPAVYRRVTVLDVTRPGSNTYGNKLDFFEYSKTFRPQVVILAYNANDVYGDQGASAAVAAPGSSAAPAPVKKGVSSGDKGLDLVASIRRVIYKSQLLEFTLQNVNMELKLGGIVLPGSEFDHQMNRSHEAGFKGWKLSQIHLREMVEWTERNHQHLIVANVPELNMLPSYGVFTRLNKAISGFFLGLGVDYVELADCFLAQPATKYAVSRYDGHPNAAAHKLIATVLTERLLQHDFSSSDTNIHAQARSSIAENQ